MNQHAFQLAVFVADRQAIPRRRFPVLPARRAEGQDVRGPEHAPAVPAADGHGAGNAGSRREVGSIEATEQSRGLGLKIDLVITTDSQSVQRVVQGDIVNVAPHLAATFAVHRSHELPGSWRVTHVETGFFVTDAPTKAEAVLCAELALAKVDQDTIDKSSAAAIKRAPWINPNPPHAEGTDSNG